MKINLENIKELRPGSLLNLDCSCYKIKRNCEVVKVVELTKGKFYELHLIDLGKDIAFKVQMSEQYLSAVTCWEIKMI
jgi:hypothetical protein